MSNNLEDYGNSLTLAMDEQERKWEEDYQTHLKKYNQHVENLKRQKEQFIKDNPDFPNVDLLFLNVIAPPQRLQIKIIK